MGNSTTTKRIGRCPLPGLYTKYPHNSRRVAPHFYTGVSLLTMHYARHHWILLMRTLTYVLCLLAWEQRKLPLSYLLASGGTALLSIDRLVCYCTVRRTNCPLKGGGVTN